MLDSGNLGENNWNMGLKHTEADLQPTHTRLKHDDPDQDSDPDGLT